MSVRIFNSSLDVGAAAGDIIKSLLKDATRSSTKVSIGLSGGSMSQLLGPILCALTDVNWNLVHFFYCDERLVPLDHKDSNHFAYEEALYSKINLPDSNIHTVNTRLSVMEAASHYQNQLLSFFGPSKGYPCFDLLLLGMGPDGHTCSLFPNHPILYCEDYAVAPISDSPKPPLERVTLTIPVINKAKSVVFMVCGQDKASAVKSTLECDQPSTSVPCTLIHPVDGPLVWLLDKAAASQLRTSN